VTPCSTWCQLSTPLITCHMCQC